MVEHKVGHKVNIVIEDTFKDGELALSMDVEIDGLSIGEGLFDYEEAYDGIPFEKLPQSIQFVHSFMAGIGDYVQ